MRKIFISAGHSISKGGARGNGYKEELLAIELRDLIVKELKLLGVSPTIDSNDNALVHTMAFFKNLVSSNSILVDIHWNAATPQATGTETLIPKTYTTFEYTLATELSKVVGDTLGLKLRGYNGVKTEAESHHGSLGWMRLTGENILLEICFITNASDMEKYQKNKLSLAKQLALTLKKHSEK